MDIFLILIGLVFLILGIIGSFLPVLPGPLTSWIGLLLLYMTKIIPLDWTFLGITLAIAAFIWGFDYFIPAIGTKHFGFLWFRIMNSSEWIIDEGSFLEF